MNDKFPEADILVQKAVLDPADVSTKGVIECINDAFGTEMPEDEVLSAIDKGIIMLGIDPQTGEVIAFASMETVKLSVLHDVADQGDTEGMYLDAVTVRKERQGQGIYKRILLASALEIIEQKLPFIACYTQNPIVERGLASVLRVLVESGQLQSFSLERHKLKGLYGRRLTGYDLEVNGTPFEELDQAAGDAFALIFRLLHI